MSRLTARQVNAKPQSFRENTATKLLSNFPTMKYQTKPQAKTMAKRRDEGPAKIVAPNYEETTIAQKPGVAEDNVERRRFDRNSKKQRESDGKRMIQRLNEEDGRQENTDASKAARA